MPGYCLIEVNGIRLANVTGKRPLQKNKNDVYKNKNSTQQTNIFNLTKSKNKHNIKI